jgi:hypothetical protein
VRLNKEREREGRVDITAVPGAKLGATLVVLLAFVGLLAPTSILAKGDVNQSECPVATETSPGFRAYLPNCRAYELVSLANSEDAAEIVGFYAFPEGEHFYYDTYLPAGEGAANGTGEQFLATRGSSGWQQTAISPAQGHGPTHLSLSVSEHQQDGVSFSADFRTAFVNSAFQDPFETPQFNEDVGMNVYGLPLNGADPSAEAELWSRPQLGGMTQTLIESPLAYATRAEVNGWGAFLAGSSANGSRVFFVTTAKLSTAANTTEDTHAAGNEIYERFGGSTYLVGVLPDGSVPQCGVEVAQGVASTVEIGHYSFGAIAPNGENVVFQTPGWDAKEALASCGNYEQEGHLFLRNVVAGTTVELPGHWYGGRAGTGAGEEEVIFTLGEPNQSGAIYEYHVTTGQTAVVGEGNLLAYSASGGRVYYQVEGAKAGLYLYENGAPASRLIPGTQAGGYLTGEEGRISGGQPTHDAIKDMPAVTPDGGHLLFIDAGQLTSYNNQGHREAYIYDAATGEVTCASCNPTGAPPTGQANLTGFEFYDNHAFHTQNLPFIYSAGGTTRAVFETTEALVPEDANNADDVYEWENGHVYLLSSGEGRQVANNQGIVDGTHLVGASSGLTDIYMESSESLLPGIDNAPHIYDARIGGGFPYSAPSYGCEPGQCRVAPVEQVGGGEPPTAASTAPGNLRTKGGANTRRGLTRATKLHRALTACRRRMNRRSRVRCEREVRQRYGAAKHGAAKAGNRRRKARRRTRK